MRFMVELYHNLPCDFNHQNKVCLILVATRIKSALFWWAIRRLPRHANSCETIRIRKKAAGTTDVSYVATKQTRHNENAPSATTKTRQVPQRKRAKCHNAIDSEVTDMIQYKP